MPPGLTKLPLNDTLPSSIQSNTFTLQGTPTACGQYPIQIVVHSYPDHQVVVQPSSFTINISGACGPPEISTASLKPWFKGLDASQQLGLDGGTPPYTWSISDPSNSGITLSDPKTGVLRWTPTTSGAFVLSVTVTDAIGRVDTKSVTLTVKSFTLSDFTGTWSGIISQGTLIQPGPVFVDLIGQRLSVLIGDPIAGVDPVNQATLGNIVLAPVQAGKPPLQFSLELGPFPGLFNGPIPQMNWHFSCDPNVAGDLICIGHSYSGAQYNTNVTLTRLNSVSQDDTKPSVSTTIPADGAQGVASFDVTVTFSEPLSSSASVAIDGGAGVEPVTFDATDPKTATFKLSGLQSNTSYTLTLNPDPAAPVHFMDLAGNALPTSTITFQTGLLNATTLSITKNGTGGGTVTSNPAGIDCGAACSAAFAGGSSVTLTAAPDSGSDFAGWSGACSGTGACTVTMDAAKPVTATFTLQRYALTVSRNGTGTGTVMSTPNGIDCGSICSATLDYGTAVTLTPTAAADSTFTGWSGACAGAGTSPCTISIDAAKSVTATFTLRNYTLAVNLSGTGSGTVTSNVGGIACGNICSATLDYGTAVTLTATAAIGSTFTGWSGVCSGTGTCAVTIDAVKTVTATFTLQTHALTVSRTGTGTGTVTSNVGGIACGATCSATLDYGTTVTLTATPATGSTFTGWSGSGITCPGTGGCSVTVYDAAKTVTATFTLQTYALTVSRIGTGTGTVTSNVGGIACGSTCSATLDYNTAVTLTAAPAISSTFTGWSGACTGTGTCAVTIDTVKSVTATFTLKTYALSVSRTGTGTGTVTSNVGGIACGATCSATFDYGTNVTLTATASGSVFTGWGGACTGTASCSVTMTAAQTVTANFDPQPTVTLTVTKSGAGSGTVTSTSSSGISCGVACAADFATGTTVTMTATPTSGSVFSGWGGACSGTASCSVTMTAAQTVTATFDLLPTYTLTVTPAGSGAGTVTSSPTGISCGATCAAGFTSGTNVTLTATPASGSVFSGWGGACSGTASCSVTMTAAQAVTATFAPLPTYTLTVTPAGSGAGTVTSSPTGISCGATCAAGFTSGTNVTLTATPASGSVFSGWGGACSGTASCSVTMTAAQAVTATFSAVPTYTLTVTPAGSGAGTVTSSPTGISCGATCAAGFTSGTNVTLTATPASGSVFSGWNGACTGITSCNVTMDAAKSVTATFNTITYTLTVTPSGNGSGTVTSAPTGITCGSTCSATFASGASVTLTATAASGSFFSGWSGGGCTGSATCVVNMTTGQSVTATFTISSTTNQPPLANNQTFTFSKRQQLTPLYQAQFAITLTGTDPEGGSLTFRIINFPDHQDVLQTMNMAAGRLYQFVDPVTGVTAQGTATTASTVDLATGTVTPSPATSPSTIIYTPNICHDIFDQDTLTFVAIDSAGLESLPATVTMNSTTNICYHN